MAGYITFCQEYAKKYYGLDLMEVSAGTTNAWNKLTNKEKRLYQIRNSESDTSLGMNRRSRSKSRASPLKARLRRKPRNASMSRSPSKMTRNATKSRRATKPSSAKLRCAPKKPRCAPKKPRCAPKKPRCAPKKSRCAPKKSRCARTRKNCPKPRCAPKRRSKRSPIKCKKPGPATSNGFLNFIAEFRKKKRGLNSEEVILKAAAAWGRLTQDQKIKYRPEAARHPKRRVTK